jgi:hypothetical protein
VKPADGLDVVVEDLGLLGEHDPERFLLDVKEVWCQHLDARPGGLVLERANRRGEVTGALVGQVVAVDGSDDHVLEPHLRRRVG